MDCGVKIYESKIRKIVCGTDTEYVRLIEQFCAFWQGTLASHIYRQGR